MWIAAKKNGEWGVRQLPKGTFWVLICSDGKPTEWRAIRYAAQLSRTGRM